MPPRITDRRPRARGALVLAADAVRAGFDPAGQLHLLAAALGDGSVRVVDPRSPTVVAVLLHMGLGEGSGAGLPAATGVAFSPSANELVWCTHAPGVPSTIDVHSSPRRLC